MSSKKVGAISTHPAFLYHGHVPNLLQSRPQLLTNGKILSEAHHKYKITGVSHYNYYEKIKKKGD
jgi:hypothetical protein